MFTPVSSLPDAFLDVIIDSLLKPIASDDLPTLCKRLDTHFSLDQLNTLQNGCHDVNDVPQITTTTRSETCNDNTHSNHIHLKALRQCAMSSFGPGTHLTPESCDMS